MVSYTKRDNTWRVQIARKGVRLHASFPPKAQAVAWATQKEAEILAGTIKIAGDKTVAETFRRYATIVFPEKRVARWEYLRIEAFCRVFPALANKRLSEVGAPEFVTWRDARLKQVSDGTVIREMNLFSNIFSIARDEWKWISASPLSGVHDTRHEAITQLAAKVDVLDLARIVGIRDSKILMVYYNRHAGDIALDL